MRKAGHPLDQRAEPRLDGDTVRSAQPEMRTMTRAGLSSASNVSGAKPHFSRSAGRNSRHHDLGMAYQLLQLLPAPPPASGPALASACCAHRPSRNLVAARRASGAGRRLPCARSYHVGAKIAKVQAQHVACHKPRQIDHPDPGQGAKSAGVKLDHEHALQSFATAINANRWVGAPLCPRRSGPPQPLASAAHEPPEHIQRTHLAALEHQFEAVEAGRVRMQSSQRNSRCEYARMAQRPPSERLHRKAR